MWKYQSEESTKNYIDYFSLPVMNLKKNLIITLYQYEVNHMRLFFSFSETLALFFFKKELAPSNKLFLILLKLINPLSGEVKHTSLPGIAIGTAILKFDQIKCCLFVADKKMTFTNEMVTSFQHESLFFSIYCTSIVCHIMNFIADFHHHWVWCWKWGFVFFHVGSERAVTHMWVDWAW